ncbi:sigma-54-dependent Fis family transcriptional regulator [Cupriavidus sp. USMAA2-4]|uniref:Sigma-54-dependent Fis family transcriptional regulator n=1 Tax=Cupriavidus malaysiensis TaxID=367825 RepID=A0ABM6FDG6_9BURK|nr:MULTISPECIES: phenol degradation transcriptional regulator PoxR [Cupriavidus]AOY96762.1 sigma-54-dependent Fis family transcriptional regulator [Cupriavidus sp. USMAA2-4]AOZ02834.1 sigma-54-dependent Fis family transcriptional regulator [Cupriavidus sp. USMAHM13]AOZ09794.1 sigma-54-dependent Fis family transcriptional regulator [Cupriavidus malaysiensis]
MSSSTDNFSATMRDGLSNLARRLRFAMKEGSIWLGEQRMILLHTAALGALRKELVDTLGMERARGLFMRMGFHSGLRDAELAKTMRSGHSDFGMLEMGPCLHTIEGVVRVTPLTVDINIAAGVYHGEFLWEDSFEGDVHRQMFGVAQAPVCWMQIGYATGYTSALMGKTILYRELECVGCGQPHCRILGKPLEQWEDGEAELALYQPDPVIDTILALQSEVEQLRALQRANDQPADLVGGSPGFRAAWNLLQRAAGSSVTVLLLGETGVGKERFAQALHGVSARADKPFVAVNCAAIPDELIESELFGVEKGAFTGAHQSRAGRFERAHGGTLFLDELGELSASAQSKLLRVLQEGEVERVGGNEARKVDVRLVAATNVDLAEAVRQGTFRKDLYYRLNVYPVTIPPLRERLDDIRLLAERFIARYGARHGKKILGITDRALAELRRYDWPGNVRELENVIERGVILAANGGQISAEQLFLPGTEAPAGVDTTPRLGEQGALPGLREAAVHGLLDYMAENGLALGEVESVLMEAAMQRADGNLSQAARLLGLTRPQLAYRWKTRGTRG